MENKINGKPRMLAQGREVQVPLRPPIEYLRENAAEVREQNQNDDQETQERKGGRWRSLLKIFAAAHPEVLPSAIELIPGVVIDPRTLEGVDVATQEPFPVTDAFLGEQGYYLIQKVIMTSNGGRNGQVAQ